MRVGVEECCALGRIDTADNSRDDALTSAGVETYAHVCKGIGHSIDKDTYNTEVPALREALLLAQYRLREQARFPILILINGIEGAGKGETIKLLARYKLPYNISVLTQVSADGSTGKVVAVACETEEHWASLRALVPMPSVPRRCS